MERCFDGFRRSDHAQILSCLTDDVVWEIAGLTHLQGKAAYDSEIERPVEFTGPPGLDVDRMVEEDEVVVATGRGAATRVDGPGPVRVLRRRVRLPRRPRGET